jgi:hypothetical protein
MSSVLAGRRSAQVAGRPMRTRRGDRGEHAGRQTLFEAVGGEPTLDDVLAGVWEGLTAHQAVDCPVCGAHMEPHHGADTQHPGDSGAARPSAADRGVAGGHCRSCDSSLT